MEAVTILLKVWNAARYVKLCLESLLQNTTSPFELIVVDNGSKHRLHQWLVQLAENDARIRLITNASNRGPGSANRQGAELASHRLICLLDSDVLVTAGWLERLAAEFDSNPDLKILVPLQPGEDTIYPFEREHTDSRKEWYALKRRHAKADPLYQLSTYTHGLSLQDFEIQVRAVNPGAIRWVTAPPDFVSSSCMLVDRDFVEKVGGIADPRFQGYGSEDVDLCWRVGAAGGKVGKTRSVYVHHFFGASLEANSLDRAAALVHANQILYEKWKDHLIDLVSLQAAAGIEGITAYLEQHFIFSALARSTTFIEDLRMRLNQPDIPDDIEWRVDPL
jgi:GT2 family glycosyltransferase